MNRKELEQLAAALGLAVYTYNPGDGMTRHKVAKPGSSYFSENGYFTGTRREAECFLRGVDMERNRR